jgi:hypothetical protein
MLDAWTINHIMKPGYLSPAETVGSVPLRGTVKCRVKFRGLEVVAGIQYTH